MLVLVVVLPESAILVEVLAERETFVAVDVSVKLPESAILVELVVEVEVERFLESVNLAFVVEVATLPLSLILVVVEETFPESAILEVEVVFEVVVRALLLFDVEVEVVVVVFGALTVVVLAVAVLVVVVTGAFTFEDVDVVVVAFETVLVAGIEELSANFQVLNRPLESRTTMRARPSDHVSVTAFPHDTKWPLSLRTTQYCFPSAHVS